MIAPVPTRATLGVGWGRGKPGETSARMVESHRAQKIYIFVVFDPILVLRLTLLSSVFFELLLELNLGIVFSAYKKRALNKTLVLYTPASVGIIGKQSVNKIFRYSVSIISSTLPNIE